MVVMVMVRDVSDGDIMISILKDEDLKVFSVESWIFEEKEESLRSRFRKDISLTSMYIACSLHLTVPTESER